MAIILKNSGRQTGKSSPQIGNESPEADIALTSALFEDALQPVNAKIQANEINAVIPAGERIPVEDRLLEPSIRFSGAQEGMEISVSLHSPEPAPNPGAQAPLPVASPSGLPTRGRMTALEASFVDQVLRLPDLDYGKAYLQALTALGKAHPKDLRRAYRSGERILASAGVQDELRRRRSWQEGLTDAQVVQLDTKLARVALADIRDYFDPVTGEAINPAKLTDNAAAALVGFEVEEFSKGKGDDQVSGTRWKYRLVDPLPAVKALYERRGVIKRDQKGGAGIVANIQINLGGG